TITRALSTLGDFRVSHACDRSVGSPEHSSRRTRHVVSRTRGVDRCRASFCAGRADTGRTRRGSAGRRADASGIQPSHADARPVYDDGNDVRSRGAAVGRAVDAATERRAGEPADRAARIDTQGDARRDGSDSRDVPAPTGTDPGTDAGAAPDVIAAAA